MPGQRSQPRSTGLKCTLTTESNASRALLHLERSQPHSKPLVTAGSFREQFGRSIDRPFIEVADGRTSSRCWRRLADQLIGPSLKCVAGPHRRACVVRLADQLIGPSLKCHWRTRRPKCSPSLADQLIGPSLKSGTARPFAGGFLQFGRSIDRPFIEVARRLKPRPPSLAVWPIN